MSMHIVAGHNAWLHGHKRGPISLQQIRTCTVVPDRSWPDAVYGCSIQVGQLVWLLEHGAAGMNPEHLLQVISGVAMWWMLVSYEDELDTFCMELVQHQCAPPGGIITVIIDPAQDPVRHATAMPVQVDVISSSLGEFLADHEHPTPGSVRQELLQRECPEGHARLLFVVPKLGASFGMVAEVGGAV